MTGCKRCQEKGRLVHVVLWSYLKWKHGFSTFFNISQVQQEGSHLNFWMRDHQQKSNEQHVLTESTFSTVTIRIDIKLHMRTITGSDKH